MIGFSEIEKQFPSRVHNQNFYQYMVKEYFQYKMLDIIFNSKSAGKLSFIGGTSLRILHGNDRFSEDLDFDSFNLSRKEFIQFTDSVIKRLQNEGINIAAEDKEKDLTINAFRRNLVFPGLLYDLKLTGNKEQKFLIKIESQSHFFEYDPVKPM